MLQDRYRLYGTLIVAVCYSYAVDLAFFRAKFFAAVIIGTTCFHFSSYATYSAPILLSREWCRATAMNWQLAECFPREIPEGWAGCCAALAEAQRTGVYALPEFLSSADLAVLRTSKATLVDGTHRFRLADEGAARGRLASPNRPVAESTLDRPIFALLSLNERDIVLPIVHTRARLAEILPSRSLLNSTEAVLLPDAVYVQGTHPVRYFARSGKDGTLHVCWSGMLDCP